MTNTLVNIRKFNKKFVEFNVFIEKDLVGTLYYFYPKEKFRAGIPQPPSCKTTGFVPLSVYGDKEIIELAMKIMESCQED